MARASVTLLASNNEAFPAGVQVWGQAKRGVLVSLARYEVEDVTYFQASRQVSVRTALGYHFTISADDYDQLVASSRPLRTRSAVGGR
jgi:hypothetical protein